MWGKLDIGRAVRACVRTALLGVAASTICAFRPESMVVAQQQAPAAPADAVGTSGTQKPSPAITDTTEYPFQKALDELGGKQSAAPAVPSVSQERAVELNVYHRRVRVWRMVLRSLRPRRTRLCIGLWFSGLTPKRLLKSPTR